MTSSTFVRNESAAPQLKSGERLRKSSSSAVVALILYVAFNCVCAHPLKARPDSNGLSVALHDYYQLAVPPKVVFMGSSVARHIFWSTPDEEVAKRKISNLTFNLQLVSDSLILAKKLFHAPRIPEVVVMFVTPRDFVDNDVPDLTRTDTFRKLVGAEDVVAIGSLLRLSPSDIARAFYSSVCCFYDQRAVVQMSFGTKVKSLYDKLGIHHGSAAQSESPWARSMREYAWRYEGLTTGKLEKQAEIFAQAIASSKKNGSRVIVVNLPISDENINLLPEGLYNSYRGLVARTCTDSNCEFLDCSTAGIGNSKENFEDCVHLSARGARQAFALLVPYLDAAPPSCESSKN